MELQYKLGDKVETVIISSDNFYLEPSSVEPGNPLEATLIFTVGQKHAKEKNLKALVDNFQLKFDGESKSPANVTVVSKKHFSKPGANKELKTIHIIWTLETGKAKDSRSVLVSVGPYYRDNTADENEVALSGEKTLQITSSLHDVLGKATENITTALEKIGNNINTVNSGTVNTRLQPVGVAGTWDLALWVLIKKATEELSFSNFDDYMEKIFCGSGEYDASAHIGRNKRLQKRTFLPFSHVDAYRSVKIAAEAFVMVNYMTADSFTPELADDLLARVPITDGNFDENKLKIWWGAYKEKVNLGKDGTAQGDSEGILPYLGVIRRKLKDESIKDTSFEEAFKDYIKKDADERDAENCFGIISQKLAYPSFLELIWSYWHEESMMVQGLSAITRRFQNIRSPKAEDPLAGLAVDPLRPLGNLLWGYIQDEQHRLSVLRRAYEYDHHYGITLEGAAVRNMRTADSRSKFMEAFHRLLHQTSEFYKNSDDMTRRPDAFPVLNALKEVHLILSEGAHNQYGDLPSTARTEMLMQQWLLARPEFREFLPTRIMVAYPEPWMDRVAALNKLQGWTETSPLHFRDLGRFGEQILLSVRFGNWSDINNRDAAFNWANFWREQIQGYIHAYRAVTGVDLSLVVVGKSVDAHPPSYHLTRRLKAQQNGTVSAPSANGKARRNGTAARNGKVKKEWI